MGIHVDRMDIGIGFLNKPQCLLEFHLRGLVLTFVIVCIIDKHTDIIVRPEKGDHCIIYGFKLTVNVDPNLIQKRIREHVNLLLHLPGGNSIGENGHQRDEEDEQQKVDQRHTGGKIFPVPERLVISLNV